jgi:AcrR family transcriptional regulator
MTDQKRPYRMKRRAELEERTRLRITESAVELHERVGPAQTSISAIAERAGVRRSTVYRHFPDERALFMACTSHWFAAHTPPDIAAWAAIEDPDERLGRALADLYGYYRSTGQMLDRSLRDASVSSLVDEMLEGYRAYLAAAADALIEGRPEGGRARRRARAAIGHALAFPTWQSLTADQGLDDAEAAELMCRLVANAPSAITP